MRNPNKSPPTIAGGRWTHRPLPATTSEGGIREGQVAVGAIFPDLDPITTRLDRIADVGEGVKVAMLSLAGALVLHTVVLIAIRPRCADQRKG